MTLSTLAADPVAPLVGAFRRRYPEVSVRIFEPDTADGVVELVRDGRSEVGLAELPVTATDLVTEHLFDDELFVIRPPGSPRSGALRLRDLDAVPLVTSPPGASTRRLAEQTLRDAGVVPRVVVETDQREAIVPLVLEGAGASFVTRPLANRAARSWRWPVAASLTDRYPSGRAVSLAWTL